MLKRLLVLIALLLPTSAFAGGTGSFDGQMVAYRSLGTVLSGVALNAAAGTRTVTITPAKQWARVLITVNYTYSAATTVTLTPTCTDSTSLTAGSILSGTVSAGVSTDVAYSRSYATGAASSNFQWSLGIAGEQSCSLVFGGASAGGGDLVTVSMTLVAK